MKRQIAVLAAAVSAVALAGAVAFTAPAALAGNSPCGTGSNTGNTGNDGLCSQAGHYTVSATLALDSDLTAFTLTSASTDANHIGAGSNGYLYVDSTDSSGYSITDMSTDWTGTPSGSFPASDVSLQQYNSAFAWASAPFLAGNAPQTFVACTEAVTGGDNCAGANAPGAKGGADYPGSGWDWWQDNGLWFNTVPVVSSGTYAATVTFALWGN